MIPIPEDSNIQVDTGMIYNNDVGSTVVIQLDHNALILLNDY